ncbi:hypothetical protein B621_gp36 [Marinomonas phage P12026]|uniref:hypothetical protein n=1 Tax=Marinomonas phage P12026 TaxID=1176423 RepID=UPI0002688F4E|nr:hypothetical protein B621_gp36 [Marinomonas phage P12026]AFM54882.1 hypothetical protein P12026_36 [Marinomonas phage P12026]
MFLEQFTKTDLQRKAPEVLESALKKPVVVTERGKDSFIIMTKEAYVTLVQNQAEVK